MHVQVNPIVSSVRYGVLIALQDPSRCHIHSGSSGPLAQPRRFLCPNSERCWGRGSASTQASNSYDHLRLSLGPGDDCRRGKVIDPVWSRGCFFFKARCWLFFTVSQEYTILGTYPLPDGKPEEQSLRLLTDLLLKGGTKPEIKSDVVTQRWRKVLWWVSGLPDVRSLSHSRGNSGMPRIQPCPQFHGPA